MYTEIGTVIAACKGLVEPTDEILSAFNACSKPRSQYKISARGWKRDARKIQGELENVQVARHASRCMNPVGSKQDIWMAVCLLGELAEAYGCLDAPGFSSLFERLCTSVTAVVQPWYRDALVGATWQTIRTAEIVLACTDDVRTSIKDVSSNVTLTRKYHEARVCYHVKRAELERALEVLQNRLSDFTTNDATAEAHAVYLFILDHMNPEEAQFTHKNRRVRALREAYESCVREIERVNAI